MSSEQIAAALQRVAAVLERRPAAGQQADDPACAKWQGGLGVRVTHPAGHQVMTDLPVELGGAAAAPSPGWLWRSALASCAVARIVMEAAAAGIVLDRLEVEAASRSDARGLLGMAEPDGSVVSPGPQDVTLTVRVAAAGVPAPALQALVMRAQQLSPVAAAAQQALPLALHVEVEAD